MVMTKFALLADIHEQLRLGGDKNKQLARLKTADDVIALYNFFYPTRKHGDPIRMIAYEAALFYDVVKDMLPDENTWMALASESANSGSRDYDCAYVAAMMEKATTFTEVAHYFNEKEARLLWRWCLNAKGVMSKRTFFGTLARLHSLPITTLQANMTTAMIAKIYNDKDSVLGLDRWYEYDMTPAPMRWQAYTSLAPPKEKHFASVVPEGKIVYSYNGHLRNRAGVKQPTANNPYKDKQDSYYELAIDTDGEVSILDRVVKASYDSPYSTRMKIYTDTQMNTDDHWDDIVAELSNPDVRCVRLINPAQQFKADAIGGYVMHSDRTKVFLRAESTETRGVVGLNAIDGVDDFIRVANTTLEMPEIPDDSCIVVEVAAVNVSSKGQLLNFTVVGVRDDLGIGDVTQFTELVERGME
tara:strand:+ start:684 stop:1928 length:1245 start_codon:yes stop_codon:yes gene_type:complete